MAKTPSYMIPLQFPTERYVYGPDIDVAHWTSSPVWSQAVFTRNNPEDVEITVYSGRVWTGPGRSHWSVQLTPHSPYAQMDREFEKKILVPADLAEKAKSASSVEEELEVLRKLKKLGLVELGRGIEYGTRNNPESKYVQSNPAKLRVVSGGKGKLKKVPEHIEKTSRKHASKISAIGKKGHWPIGDLYHARLAMIYILSPSHKKVRNKVIAAVQKHYPEYDWKGWLRDHETKTQRVAANPRSRAKNNSPNRDMFTISRANPMPNPLTGPPYPAAQYVDGAPPTPLTLPTNAGPFLPDMFPYGVGGRVLKVNPRKKYVKV